MMGDLRLHDHRRPTRAADPPTLESNDISTIAVLASSRVRGRALVQLLRANGLAATTVGVDRLAAGIRDGSSAVAVVTGEMLRSAATQPLLLAASDQPAWSDYPFVIVPEWDEKDCIGLTRLVPNAVLIARPLRHEALLSAVCSAMRARRRQWSVAALANQMWRPDTDAERAQRQRATALALYASRIGAMGEMASALAHEINQPLSAITNYVAGCRRLLATATATGAEADLRALFGALATAEAETMRAGEIVRRMRETVKVAEVPRLPTRLSAIIDQACRIALVDEPSVAVHIHVVPDDMEVKVDCVAIQHVLVSLVRNCCDGIRGNPQGRVLISARIVAVGFAEIRVSYPRPGADETTGVDPFSAVGIHQEDEVRIRLAICRTIVEAHGGAIGTDGTGADACVAFTLPLAATVDPDPA